MNDFNDCFIIWHESFFESIKTYGEVDVWFHAFLSSALDGGEQ